MFLLCQGKVAMAIQLQDIKKAKNFLSVDAIVGIRTHDQRTVSRVFDHCGQCYKTFYGRNYVAIGVTQSKS